MESKCRAALAVGETLNHGIAKLNSRTWHSIPTPHCMYGLAYIVMAHHARLGSERGAEQTWLSTQSRAQHKECTDGHIQCQYSAIAVQSLARKHTQAHHIECQYVPLPMQVQELEQGTAS